MGMTAFHWDGENQVPLVWGYQQTGSCQLETGTKQATPTSSYAIAA
jgi:hypothetical protein